MGGETSFASERQLKRILAAFVLLATLGLIIFVTLYARNGQSILDSLESVEPITVYRQGFQFESAGKIDEAIDAYRRALALGLSWPPSREACLNRLRLLVTERGRIPGYRSDPHENLLRNGDFEEAEVTERRWFEGTTPPAGLAFDAVECVTPTTSLRAELASAANPLIRQYVNLIPGDSYHFSIWMRLEGVAAEGVALGVMDGGGAVLASSESVSGTRDWKQYALGFTMPAEATGAYVTVGEGSGSSQAPVGAGRVWVDAGALARSERDFLLNGSFEQGGDASRDWRAKVTGNTPTSGRPVLSADDAVRVEGSQSLRIEMDEQTTVNLWQTIQVTPGERYRLTGWVRTDLHSGGGARLQVRDAYRGAKAFHPQSPEVGGSRDWTPLELEFTVPKDTLTINVILHQAAVGKAAPAVGTIWFDAYALNRIQGAGSAEGASAGG